MSYYDEEAMSQRAERGEILLFMEQLTSFCYACFVTFTHLRPRTQRFICAHTKQIAEGERETTRRR
jgi:hypothetical protein